MGTGDVSLACMSILVDELVLGGLRHACVSPGSRSTPIALALERDPRVTVHVHLDERASAFFALGIAKATGMPAVVACTSGTAAANFFPAVVEASQARVPLIVLTADRPPRLRGTGANQTIDQVELYGRYVRWFVDAPIPSRTEATSTWAGIGRQASSAALDRPRGPVHINLPFEEPLTPERDVEPRRTTGLSVWTGSLDVTDTEAKNAARELNTERGVVVVGSMPAPPTVTLSLARQMAWPVLAEPTSGLRVPGVLAGGQGLVSCDAFAAANTPDVVLQIGAAPITRATQRFVSHARRLVVVDRDHLDPDPEHRAAWRLERDPEQVSAAVLRKIDPRSEGDWSRTWRTADAVARSSIDRLYDAWEEPYEGRTARDLAAWIPAGGTLVVGSSMPIRDLDYSMAPRDGLRVLANRGASGIDGLVSTVLGVAATGTPTYALCGDLTLLHDAGSLLWSARRALNAVFVVPNNDGGAIFDFLPQRALPEHERLFTTPHGLDLGALCAAAGAGHTRIERAA